MSPAAPADRLQLSTQGISQLPCSVEKFQVPSPPVSVVLLSFASRKALASTVIKNSWPYGNLSVPISSVASSFDTDMFPEVNIFVYVEFLSVMVIVFGLRYSISSSNFITISSITLICVPLCAGVELSYSIDGALLSKVVLKSQVPNPPISVVGLPKPSLKAPLSMAI